MAAANGWSGLSSMEREGLPGGLGLAGQEVDAPVLFSVSVAELQDTERCAEYLDRLGAHIGSPNRRVSASMLAKRYAHLAITPVLHGITWYQKGIRLSPDDCVLVCRDYSSFSREMSKFPELMVRDLSIAVPEKGARTLWRETMLTELFAGHVTPLFRVLSEAGGVPMAILWENAAVRIAPLYEDELDAEQARDDYGYIARHAPADVFGQRKHPLLPYLEAETATAEAFAARGRKTCCLYYEMAPEYCRKCPKVKSASL